MRFIRKKIGQMTVLYVKKTGQMTVLYVKKPDK